MRPPKRENIDYERIPVYDEWIKGVIEDVQLEENHQFKGQFAKVGDAVRFKFKLEGCEYSHRSGWMTYSYGEKSNLFLKYLKYLVEGAEPDMDFDLDKLRGLKVKTMWSANGDYDNLEQIRPLEAKVARAGTAPAAKDDVPEVVGGHHEENDIPF